MAFKWSKKSSWSALVISIKQNLTIFGSRNTMGDIMLGSSGRFWMRRMHQIVSFKLCNYVFKNGKRFHVTWTIQCFPFMITDPSLCLCLHTKSLCCELLCVRLPTKSFIPTIKSTKLAVHYPCSGFLKKSFSRFFFLWHFPRFWMQVKLQLHKNVPSNNDLQSLFVWNSYNAIMVRYLPVTQLRLIKTIMESK